MTYTKVEAKNTVDPIWQAMRRDAEHWLVEETALASWLQTAVLEQNSFQTALAFLLSAKLGSSEINPLSLYQILYEPINQDLDIIGSARADLSATYEETPHVIVISNRLFSTKATKPSKPIELRIGCGIKAERRSPSIYKVECPRRFKSISILRQKLEKVLCWIMPQA